MIRPEVFAGLQDLIIPTTDLNAGRHDHFGVRYFNWDLDALQELQRAPWKPQQ